VAIAASWSQISASTLYRERVTNERNVQARVVIQDWSIKVFQERPVFGWGYGSFNIVKRDAQLGSAGVPRVFETSTSHNTFLTILVESGTLGLTLFLLPWVSIFWGAVKNALAHPEVRWFLVGSLAALTVYFVTANVSDRRYFSLLPALAWMFLGILRRHQLARA
jgi:O-antigen ligase